jgi:hypothetical protein
MRQANGLTRTQHVQEFVCGACNEDDPYKIVYQRVRATYFP